MPNTRTILVPSPCDYCDVCGKPLEYGDYNPCDECEFDGWPDDDEEME